MSKDTLELSVEVAASTQKVWATLIHPGLWWDDVMLEPKLGGAFQEMWQEDAEEKIAEGRIVSFIPGKELAIEWSESDWPKPMTFTFTLKQSESSGTYVTLTEQDWSVFPGTVHDELKNAHSQGWHYHLQALKAAAESDRS